MRLLNYGAFLLAIAALTATAGCEQRKHGNLEASGTIESDDVRVSTLVGGRVAEVLIQEGEKVEKDQVLLKIDTLDYELQANQARAVLKAVTAQNALAHKGARAEDIASAKELMEQAKIGEAAAKADLKRAEELNPEGAVTNKQLDDARSRASVVSSQRRTAELQYQKALNGARPEELDAVNAQLEQAGATVKVIEKKIADCEVKAPRGGMIIHRLAEPGEIVGPGNTLFVLENLDTVKLTVFVPEAEIGKVRLGDEVNVRLDSFPDKPVVGKVSRIRDQAEFTPRNVQTRDERVKLVFGVEITVDNKDGYLKPGLPADAIFPFGQGAGQ